MNERLRGSGVRLMTTNEGEERFCEKGKNKGEKGDSENSEAPQTTYFGSRAEVIAGR